MTPPFPSLIVQCRNCGTVVEVGKICPTCHLPTQYIERVQWTEKLSSS